MKHDGISIGGAGLPRMPDSGTWSPRLMSLREMVESIGKDLPWDNDWMPCLLVDGLVPEDLPGGEKPPPEKIGQPSLFIVGLPDAMKDEESKDQTAMIIPLLALKCRAIGMTLVSTVWMSEMKPIKEVINENETDDEMRERIYAAARAHVQPSQDPNRKEKLMIHSIYFGTEDDGQKIAFADIKRTPPNPHLHPKGLPPELYNWHLWDDSDLGSGFMGRFPEAIYEGLKMSWEIRAAEHTKGGGA
jgi:hypothetical protein